MAAPKEPKNSQPESEEPAEPIIEIPDTTADSQELAAKISASAEKVSPRSLKMPRRLSASKPKLSLPNLTKRPIKILRLANWPRATLSGRQPTPRVNFPIKQLPR